ncbi:MAG: hypothetical protein QOF29_1742 [bacterium]|jgi:hypothetical protein|nr:hypothetical protein [Solirubrobacteraceae bacterium]
MAARPDTLASSRLRRLAQRSAAEREAEAERCDLCGEAIASEHRHLLDLSTRELMCSCRACSLLFDRDAASAGHYRLVPDRRLRIDDFALDDLAWEELRLPVDLAFFFRGSQAGRVMAYYPSPMGATESLLGLDAWQQLEDANPVLRTLEDDVEALLVNHARGARRHWIVPIEDCFTLVGVIRMHWKGLTGGKDVWEEIGGFCDRLDRRARAADRHGARRTTAASADAALDGR